MEEIWKDIQGYEGLYQVSNFGNIKSLHYGSKVNHPNWITLKEKILKPKLTTSGYYRVELYKPNSRKCLYIHRLVAMAFLPNPNNKPEVNHKDGNKLNNNLDNLEWTSISENQRHAIEHGLRKPSPMTGRTGSKSPCSKAVLQCDLDGNVIKKWDSITNAKKALKLKSTSSISSCLTHRYKTAGGFTWRYASE